MDQWKCLFYMGESDCIFAAWVHIMTIDVCVDCCVWQRCTFPEKKKLNVSLFCTRHIMGKYGKLTKSLVKEQIKLISFFWKLSSVTSFLCDLCCLSMLYLAFCACLSDQKSVNFLLSVRKSILQEFDASLFQRNYVQLCVTSSYASTDYAILRATPSSVLQTESFIWCNDSPD